MESGMTFLQAFHQGTNGNLFAIPRQPNADDDEFNTPDLNAAWAWYHVSGSSVTPGNIDVYSSVSGSIKASLTDRPSWLMIQPGYALIDQSILHKPITLGTNTLIWARMTTRTNLTSATNNEVAIGIALSDEISGTPTRNNSVECYLMEADSGIRQAKAAKTVAGVVSSIGVTDNTNQMAQPIEYVAIHKLGTTYHFWCAPSAGNWVWMGSTTHSTPFTRLCIYSYGEIHNKPGTQLAGIDFVRRVDTSQFIL